MVSKVQRLGGGPGGVAVACWRASSPGPWCRRSSSCRWRSWSWLKGASAWAAMLMGQQTGESFVVVVVKPSVDGVRVAMAEQARVGHGIRGLPVRNLKQGGTAFPDVGFGVVIAMVEQGGALAVRERQGT